MQLSSLRNTKYIFLIGFAVLGLVIILTSTLPNSFQYYVTVSEFVAEPTQYKDTEIKLAGQVVPGTIIQDKSQNTWAFEVFHDDAKLPVSYTGAMPDTFNEDAEVVLTGMYANNTFEANHVLAKCASRYEAKLTPGLETQG